jgi:hypothetical protein
MIGLTAQIDPLGQPVADYYKHTTNRLQQGVFPRRRIPKGPSERPPCTQKSNKGVGKCAIKCVSFICAHNSPTASINETQSMQYCTKLRDELKI